METRARETRGRTEGYTGLYNAQVHNGIRNDMGWTSGSWGVGFGAFQGGRSSGKGIHRYGVPKMITNIACVILLLLNAVFALSLGAYNHVVTKMAMQNAIILSLPLVALSEVEVKL